MTHSATQAGRPDHSATAPARLATRLAFFAAGFAIACWAPLIPFVKDKVGAGEAAFGVLLLFLGVGSLIAMPVTGIVAARAGARPMILLGGFGLAFLIPFLPHAGAMAMLGGLLLLIGACLGTIDVAMNVHAAEVEQIEARPLMSGFHALFSIGGFFGAGLMTALLSLGLSPAVAALFGGAITLAAMVYAAPRFLRAKGGEPETFAFPKGIVMLLAVLAAIGFLVEGAVLDWGALLLIERSLSTPQSAGLGFMVFSATMVLGRLTGDRIVAAFGDYPILVAGGVLGTLGLVVVLLAPTALSAMAGFALMGLGMSNIVPVFFSLAGRQKIMPPGLAIASVTITGYAGILIGPAIVGFAAELTNLKVSFWVLAVLLALVPLFARAATKGS